jgi:hypothetical protein
VLYVIHALDKPDAAALRQEHYAAHRAHVAEAAKWNVAIVMSGPLVADDGSTPVGSHLVVEAATREVVESFHRADPFFQAGLWKTATVLVFNKKIG